MASEDIDEDMEANIRGINEEQELILHQELLPAQLMENIHMDSEHMRVLTPTELIELYICDDNTTATEYDFKKALDLMQFIDTDDTTVDFGAIQTGIWCKALLRDRAVWLQTPTGHPFDSVKDTIFCKTVALCEAEGKDPDTFLPHKNRLLSAPEMGELGKDKQLQYMVGAIYELINTME